LKNKILKDIQPKRNLIASIEAINLKSKSQKLRYMTTIAIKFVAEKIYDQLETKFCGKMRLKLILISTSFPQFSLSRLALQVDKDGDRFRPTFISTKIESVKLIPMARKEAMRTIFRMPGYLANGEMIGVFELPCRSSNTKKGFGRDY
jgi:hypothetical protein